MFFFVPVYSPSMEMLCDQTDNGFGQKPNYNPRAFAPLLVEASKKYRIMGASNIYQVNDMFWGYVLKKAKKKK